jgi:hypothetical protein
VEIGKRQESRSTNSGESSDRDSQARQMREELAYIQETFPIVERKNDAQVGEYRTRSMIV